VVLPYQTFFALLGQVRLALLLGGPLGRCLGRHPRPLPSPPLLSSALLHAAAALHCDVTPDAETTGNHGTSAND
jgi:hypothetical protein